MDVQNCIQQYGYGISTVGGPWTVRDVLSNFTVEQLLELREKLPAELQTRITRLEHALESTQRTLEKIRSL